MKFESSLVYFGVHAPTMDCDLRHVNPFLEIFLIIFR